VAGNGLAATATTALSLVTTGNVSNTASNAGGTTTITITGESEGYWSGFQCDSSASVSTTTVQVTCTAVVMKSSGGLYKRFSNVSAVVAITSNGIPGLLNGASVPEASSTWYYLYLAGKEDGTSSAFLDTSYPNPSVALSGGYTYYRVMDVIRNNNLGNLNGHINCDGVVSTNVPDGSTSTDDSKQCSTINTTGTMVNIDVSAWVPPCTREAYFFGYNYDGAGATTGSLILNSDPAIYGSYLGQTYLIYYSSTVKIAFDAPPCLVLLSPSRTTSARWTHNGAAGGYGRVYCVGWRWRP
jgi:hypothetical protein